MNNPYNKFETVLLRHLYIIAIITAIVFFINGRWWWGAGAVLSLVYIGTIGAGLHPYQSASDLCKGPTRAEKGKVESATLPEDIKRMLVSRACTKVGILFGIISGAIFSSIIGWSWYFVLPSALFVTATVGTMLKVIFDPWWRSVKPLGKNSKEEKQ